MDRARTTLLILVLFLIVFGTGFQALPDEAWNRMQPSTASIETPSLAAAPAAFNKTSPANGSPQPASGIVLKWEASSSNVTYQYCIHTNGKKKDTCLGNKWTSVGVNTSTALVTQNANTTFYWQVRAVDKTTGAITYANGDAFWSFKTSLTAPGAFSKITPANNAVDTARNLTLTWTASAGTDVYYEYCIYGPALNGNTCGTWVRTDTNSAPISDLDFGASYAWQVRAVNAAGTTYANGSVGAVWTFRTKIAPPAAFEKSSPANGSTGQPLNPVLSWSPSAGTGVHYEYCIYGPALNGNACNTWTTVTTTSVTIEGLDYNTAYAWQVRAVNTSGTTYAGGSASAVWSFTTLMAPPYPFFKLSPANASTGQPLDLVLVWNPSDGAETYQYCIDASDDNACDGNDWHNAANAGADAFAVLPKLQPDTQYFWQVRAINSMGEALADPDPVHPGVYDWFSFTTLSVAPEFFNKIYPPDQATNQPTSPYLYWWTPVDAENSYEYCVNTTASCPVGGWTPITENSYIHLSGGQALAYGATYYWQVRATKLGVSTEADAGTWWSFTTVQAPPSSSNQAFTTPEDQVLAGQLLPAPPLDRKWFFTLVGGLPVGKLTLQSNGQFSYTPVANYNGQVGFRFILSDGVNPPTGPFTATIDVTPVNDAPVLQAIPDQVVTAGNTVRFTASAADVDTVYGQSLSYALVGIVPAGVTLNSLTGEFAWVTERTLAPGVYLLTIKVTDSGAAPLSHTQTVRITVNPGLPVTGGTTIYLPITLMQ